MSYQKKQQLRTLGTFHVTQPMYGISEVSGGLVDLAYKCERKHATLLMSSAKDPKTTLRVAHPIFHALLLKHVLNNTSPFPTATEEKC